MEPDPTRGGNTRLYSFAELAKALRSKTDRSLLNQMWMHEGCKLCMEETTDKPARGGSNGGTLPTYRSQPTGFWSIGEASVGFDCFAKGENVEPIPGAKNAWTSSTTSPPATISGDEGQTYEQKTQEAQSRRGSTGHSVMTAGAAGEAKASKDEMSHSVRRFWHARSEGENCDF